MKAIVEAAATSAKTRGLVTSFVLVEADADIQPFSNFGVTKFPSLILVVRWDYFCQKGETFRIHPPYATQREGKRTREIWEKVELPDYSVLLSSKIWIDAFKPE